VYVVKESGLFLLVDIKSVLHRVLQKPIYLHTYYTFDDINNLLIN